MRDSKNGYAVVFITCPTTGEARTIANTLLKKKLIACANIIPRIESIYRWQGKIEKSSELLVIIKTREELVNKLISLVKKLHSYSVPEIISIPIARGNRDYLDWIKDSVSIK